MTEKRELRRALRDRKRALRRSVISVLARARAQLEGTPAMRRARSRRRLHRGLGVATVLALLLWLRFNCEGAPPLQARPAAAVASDGGTTQPRAANATPSLPARAAPLRGELSRQSRARYQPQGDPPPAWLEELRIQVGARSPRLSACFQGTQRPGALRWSAAINGESGAVSDHQLEPVSGTALDEAQRDCVVRALSQPPYRLQAISRQPDALASRVSMVIEF